MHVADEISTRIERLERERHRTVASRWFSGSVVHYSLVLSAWVMSCIVAMRIGVFSTQVGSRSQGPPLSRSERRL
jgi:ABC-type proline/glycine betaine transport system permease subunit